jgi:hypothetical protein
MMVLALSTALALLGAQDQPPPHPKFEAKPVLTLAEKDGQWVFTVAGTSTLPKGVVLRARVYAVEIVPQFQGQREDEEPLIWEDEEGQAAYQKIEIDGLPFKTDVYRFARKPWALLYRTRLLYNPRDQSDAILQLVGNDEYSWPADLKFGDDALLIAQNRERVQEVADDLDLLEAYFHDFRKAYAAQQKKLDVDAWKEWKAVWYGRIERVNERNKVRYGLWAVWMERQAKMRVGGMCELLRRMLVCAGEDLIDKQEGAAARTRQIVDAYEGYFEEAIEVLGIERPLDPEKIGPLVAAYEAALAPLREAATRGAVASAEAAAEARRGALSAILKIPQLLKTRKRGYKYANDLSARFTSLLEAAETSPDALRTALGEHDEALRAFKRFAGLK